MAIRSRYEVFAGNRHDATTLQEIVARMERRYGRINRIWALDRGMVSENNVQWLRQRGSRYIVGTPKCQLRRFERQLIEGQWTEVREGLQVKTCKGPDGCETFILCRSESRKDKERAMRERFQQRIEAGLEKIRVFCDSLRQKVGTIERRVGRLMGQNSRAAGLFEVQVVDSGGRASLAWSWIDG